MNSGSILRLEVDELRCCQAVTLQTFGLPQDIAVAAYPAKRHSGGSHQRRKMIDVTFSIGRKIRPVGAGLVLGENAKVAAIEFYCTQVTLAIISGRTAKAKSNRCLDAQTAL